MTERTPDYEIEVRVTLREGYRPRQTAYHSESAASLQEASLIFGRFTGAVDQIRQVLKEAHHEEEI